MLLPCRYGDIAPQSNIETAVRTRACPIATRVGFFQRSYLAG